MIKPVQDAKKAVNAVKEGDYYRLHKGVKHRFTLPYRTAKQRYNRASAKREINRLDSVDSDACHELARAFRVWINRSFSVTEQDVFDAIQARKSELKDDDTEVTYSFHGPNDEGLTQNTYDGKEVTVKVGDFPHAPDQYGELLTALTKHYCTGDVVEFGTCLGTSVAYIAAGATDQHVTTYEAGEPQIEIATETLERLNLHDHVTIKNELFQDAILEADHEDSFTMAFLDGHHHKESTLAYFDNLADAAEENGLIVFDDVNGYTEGMEEAWQEIRCDGRVDVSILTNRYGIVLLNSDVAEYKHFKIPY